MSHARSEELFAAVTEDPLTTLFATNFDGTLAPFGDPEDVIVPADVRDALAETPKIFGLALAISGRPAAELESRIRVPGLLYGGQHGAELVSGGGVVWRDEGFFERASVVRNFVGQMATWLDILGVKVQEQGVIRTLHFRGTTDEQVVRLTSHIRPAAEQLGLQVAALSGCVDLRPAPVSKGTLIRMLVSRSAPGGIRSAIAPEGPIKRAVSIGDDVSDAEGWESLKRLEDDGFLDAVLRVGVVHPGRAVAQIEQHADLIVTSVAEVGRLIRRLTDRARRGLG